MPDTSPTLLSVLSGEAAPVPPVWLMRQAGRYLPEYRELRARKGGFLELVMDPDAACEVTVQPIRRFGLDAAILFSDILVVPLAMGQEVRFEAGEGPVLSPALKSVSPLAAAIQMMQLDAGRLKPIIETVRKTRAALPAQVPLIGFAGSPWTVATYMAAGEGSKDQADARLLAYRDPMGFGALITRVTDMTIAYLAAQIEAGADAIMLFDSWSGALSPPQFERWVIRPTAAIVASLGGRVPIIGFPRGAGDKLGWYAQATGVTAVGLDETASPADLPKTLPVQGNLDPIALLAGGAALDRAIDETLERFEGRPHIFNLGHGIDKETPIAHVEQLLKRVRG
jgi:uroporphyrinogen decarboxylase